MSSSANDMPAFDFQKAVRDLVESVDRNQDYMRKQFDAIDSRFDAIDSRFDAIDSRFGWPTPQRHQRRFQERVEGGVVSQKRNGRTTPERRLTPPKPVNEMGHRFDSRPLRARGCTLTPPDSRRRRAQTVSAALTAFGSSGRGRRESHYPKGDSGCHRPDAIEARHLR